MLRERVSWLAAACAAAAVLAGGCGDDEGGDVPIDVSGCRKLTGDMGGVFGCLEQTGGDVAGVIGDFTVAGTVSGDTLAAVLGDPGSGDYGTMTMTATGPDTLSETGDMYEGGALVGTFSGTMERFTTSGDFAASGTIGGQAVSIDTTDLACGMVEDDGSEVTARVTYLESADYVAEMLFFPGSSVLGEGTFSSVGTDINVEFRVTTPAGRVNDYAASGSVAITKFDAGGFVGSFNITLNGGGTLTGTFDVPCDIATGTPF